jgi:type II secretory pathway pseudopilin PulG
MKRGEAGFTVVEALVATLLTLVVGAAVTASMVFTTNVVGENTLAAEAIALGQEALEDLRTVPYGDIESGTNTSPDGLFTITRHVVADSPEAGMKRIEVTVRWTWKGHTRSYAFHTVYSRIQKT